MTIKVGRGSVNAGRKRYESMYNVAGYGATICAAAREQGNSLKGFEGEVIQGGRTETSIIQEGKVENSDCVVEVVKRRGKMINQLKGKIGH